MGGSCLETAPGKDVTKLPAPGPLRKACRSRGLREGKAGALRIRNFPFSEHKGVWGFAARLLALLCRA